MIEGFRRSSTRRSLVGLAAIAVCAALAAVAATAALADPPPALFAGGTNGVVFVHGAHGAGNPHKNRSQQLLYHNGGVMTTGASVRAIFWGSSWNSSNFAGDKIAGIDTFYNAVGSTAYSGTNTEYTQLGGQTVSDTVSYSDGHVVDLSATPNGAPSTSAVLAVVANNVANPTPNGYYPVYSERGRGNAGYCAWHSWGTINGVPIQFAFFFNLDGDAGCDAGTAGGHSQGLTALGNVSGHELSEALTDPRGAGWLDQSGNENADKCAWTFGNLVQLKGSQWKIQGNWSNNAYTNGGSYLGAGSGCIDGNKY
jgi:hypothetical protein